MHFLRIGLAGVALIGLAGCDVLSDPNYWDGTGVYGQGAPQTYYQPPPATPLIVNSGNPYAPGATTPAANAASSQPTGDCPNTAQASWCGYGLSLTQGQPNYDPNRSAEPGSKVSPQ